MANEKSEQDNKLTAAFPSDFVPHNEKKQDKYGLDYAKAIYNKWKHAKYSSEQLERFKEARRYAEGLQSVNKYKDLLDMDGDTSQVNLDYSIIPIIPKYVDIMVGEMINQEYKVRLEAIDKVSKTDKDKARNKMLADIKLKNFRKKLSEVVGVDMVNEKYGSPKSEEEVDLFMQMNFKLQTEIDMEKANELVFYNNDWDEVRKRVYRDFVCLKRGGTRVYYDENDNIRQRYLDMVRYIHPFTNKPDFSDCVYGGEIIDLTVAEIRRRSKGKLSEKDLYDIAKRNAGDTSRDWNYGETYEYYYSQFSTTSGTALYDDFLVSCLDFEFLSINTDKYEKKKNNKSSFFVNKKGPNYEVPEGKEGEREILRDEYEVAYSGVWIIGSDHIVDYGLVRNMPREKTPGGYSPNTSLSFIVYAPDIYDLENKSHVERMIPHGDQAQIVHLKQQQLLARIAPPGIAVDVSALREINLGVGQDDATPLELLELYRQTGVYFYEGQDEEGQQMNRRPIEEIPNSSGSIFQELIGMYQFEVQMIRDVTGLNETRDASSENSKALVGVEQMRLKLSRNATTPLTSAYLNVYRRTAVRSTLMIQDLIDLYGDELDTFVNVLGEMGVQNIKLGATHSMAQFGIKTETVMDDAEKVEVEQNIQTCLANGTLDIEDAITIREINNYKLANQYLKLSKKRKREEDMMEAKANSEANAEIQERSAAAKAQADAQLKQQDYALKAQFDDKQTANKIALEQAKHKMKMEELAMGGEFKSRHIQEASDEDFKKTALTDAVQQPKVFSGSETKQTNENAKNA